MSNTGKKKEERSEKVIRGLLKLPSNRRCINCNSLGPQYVCTNFWTFICVTCSGIHREFTHRVKSISMAKFTTLEIDALQEGGNQRAREIFLKDWDAKQMRAPDNSQVDEIRDFIKKVYVEKQYIWGEILYQVTKRQSGNDNCPKEHEDHRGVNSFQSFFQSPPHVGQYDQGRYCKTSNKLSRKAGSDHRRYVGKLSSLLYSPEHQEEDIFDNEASCWSISDFSNSSRRDASLSSDECSKSEGTGNASPPLKQVRDILNEEALTILCNKSPKESSERIVNVKPCPLRTAIASSNETSNSNFTASGNSRSLIDIFLEPANSSHEQQLKVSSSASLYEISGFKDTNDKNLISQTILQQPIALSVSSIDLSAVGNLSSPMITLEQKSLTYPTSENVGWATFETLDQALSDADINQEHCSLVVPGANKSDRDNLQWVSAQSAVCDPLPFLSMQDIFTEPPNRNTTFQIWNVFDDINGNVPQASYDIEPSKSTKEVWLSNPANCSPEEAIPDGFEVAAKNVSSGCSSACLSPSPASQLKEVSTQTVKSANPFDIPCDFYVEMSNAFPNMSSLEVVLPDSPFPSILCGDLPETWVTQKSVTDYIPILLQGGPAYGTALQEHICKKYSSLYGWEPFYLISKRTGKHKIQFDLQH